MEKIGFIGLGNMGRGICKCILQKGGYEGTVYDISPEAAEWFRGKAKIAADTMEVFRESDVIFLSVPSSIQVEKICGEYLKAGVEGKTVVDLSTSYPGSTRELYARFKEAGGNFIDAPLMGGPADGESGTFTAVCGGDKDVIDRLDPIFRCYCKSYDYLGAAGNGHVVKIVMNYLGLSYVALIAEMFPLMEKMGMDVGYIDEVLRHTPALYNGCYEFYVPKILDRSYTMAFALELAMKDLIYMQKMFNDAGAPAFALDGVIDLLRAGVKDGRGKRDYSECAATMRDYLKI